MRVVRNILDSKTKTATGGDSADNREGKDLSEARGNIELYAVVTAASGTTPTLVIQVDDGFYIQETMGTQGVNSGETYRNSVLVSPPTLTTTGTYLIGTLTDYGTMIRFSWTIGGTTPSFTFELYAVYEVAD